MADAAEMGERWFAAIQRHDMDGALACLSGDVDFQQPGGSMVGRDAVAPFVGGYVEAFPDGTFTIGGVFGSGSTAAIEGVYRGTHTGTLHGPAGDIPPTGRSVSLPFVTVFETDGGLITSHRAYWDQMAFMVQLGLMPEG